MNVRTLVVRLPDGRHDGIIAIFGHRRLNTGAAPRSLSLALRWALLSALQDPLCYLRDSGHPGRRKEKPEHARSGFRQHRRRRRGSEIRNSCLQSRHSRRNAISQPPRGNGALDHAPAADARPSGRPDSRNALGAARGMPHPLRLHVLLVRL